MPFDVEMCPSCKSVALAECEYHKPRPKVDHIPVKLERHFNRAFLSTVLDPGDHIAAMAYMTMANFQHVTRIEVRDEQGQTPCVRVTVWGPAVDHVYQMQVFDCIMNYLPAALGAISTWATWEYC